LYGRFGAADEIVDLACGFADGVECGIHGNLIADVNLLVICARQR
jgi:hypothetical protein